VSPREELLGPEGLGDVVVRPEIEPPDPVGRVIAGGEDEHRDVALGAVALEHVEAVGPGEHQVEDHEGEGRGVDPRRLVAVAHPLGRVPRALEVLHDLGPELLIVLHHEDAVRHAGRRVAARAQP